MRAPASEPQARCGDTEHDTVIGTPVRAALADNPRSLENDESVRSSMRIRPAAKKTMTGSLAACRVGWRRRLGSAACSGREGTGGVHGIAWMVERARAAAGHSRQNPLDGMETALSGALDGR